jgi:hypothetical protein
MESRKDGESGESGERLTIARGKLRHYRYTLLVKVDGSRALMEAPAPSHLSEKTEFAL